MQYRGLKRATAVLDSRQGMFNFYHASYSAAKEYCLGAFIRWGRDKQHVQEVGGVTG